jgi:hypothetical protein
LQIAACSLDSAALYWVMESAPSIVDAAGFVFDFGMVLFSYRCAGGIDSNDAENSA